MTDDNYSQKVSALVQLICGRSSLPNEILLADGQPPSINDLRVRLLLSADALKRWPNLRSRFEAYLQQSLSHELKRFTTLKRFGLPQEIPDLNPESAVPTSSEHRNRDARSDLCLAVIASKNYVPFAHVTISSFRKFHGDIPIFLLLVDGTSEDRSLVPDCTTLLLSDLDLPNRGWYMAKYDASQLANASKPAFLLHLQRFARRAIYLDADVAVYSRCGELLENLQKYSLVLTPHTLAPFPRPEQLWVHPNNADIFNSGLFNAGVFGIDLDKCTEFLRFWSSSNFAVGGFYAPAGGQTDQQYLNWAIIMQEDVHILRDPAYNVAYWNLHERDVRCVADPIPTVTVNDRPLALFHFSGFDIYNPMRLSKHDNRYSVYNLPFIATILLEYSNQVLSRRYGDLLAVPYRFDVLPNGFRLTEFIRGILKKYENYIPKYNVEAHQDAEKLCRFLMTPLAATGSLLPLVAAVIYEQRTDLQRLFPRAHTDTTLREYWHWFCHHAGREYDLDYLISEHRQILVSDSLVGFSEQLSEILVKSGVNYAFLGRDRLRASNYLRTIGRIDLSDSLMAGHNEWFYFSSLSAVLCVYLARPDLQSAFPKIFGKSHDSFSEWLHVNAGREHGLSATAIQVFVSKIADETLARIFNFLSRRNDIADLIERQLLADENVELARELIRGSGEGMEYDLGDVEVFLFLHRRERELLVPLFLELPRFRRAGRSARVPDQKAQFFPKDILGMPWADHGSKLHDGYFDLFNSLVEDEIKCLFAAGGAAPAHIFDVIRRIDVTTSPVQAFSIASAAARRRLRKLEGGGGNSSGSTSLSRAPSGLPKANIFGFFHADTGVGESARGLARAVGTIREVQKVSLPTGSLQEQVKLGALFHRYEFDSDTNIIVSYPHQHEDHFGTLPAEYFWGRKNIVHLAWEQKDWNPHWKAVYNRYDEIWAISAFAAAPFQAMFGDRVRVVPNVLNFEEYPKVDHDMRDGKLQGIFRFLYIFDANSSIERKNPDGCLQAFIAAFKGRPQSASVQLYFKIGNLNRPEHSARIARLKLQAYQSGLNIVFDGRKMSRDALMRLIGSANCYVSLHRAEGFGYTMAEAMFYAVPVIASGYSGNLEYMSAADSYLIPCVETYVKDPDGPFQRGSVWGEPDLDSAVAAMREVVAQPQTAVTIGEAGRAAVLEKLNAHTIGALLRPSLLGEPSAPRNDRRLR